MCRLTFYGIRSTQTAVRQNALSNADAMLGVVQKVDRIFHIYALVEWLVHPHHTFRLIWLAFLPCRYLILRFFRFDSIQRKKKKRIINIKVHVCCHSTYVFSSKWYGLVDAVSSSLAFETWKIKKKPLNFTASIESSKSFKNSLTSYGTANIRMAFHRCVSFCVLLNCYFS